METKKIEKNKKVSCIYCGDSPTWHAYSYFGNFMAMMTEPMFKRTSRLLPNSLRMQIENVLKLLLIILIKLRIVTFSDDINKATTLRSKIIWEEAKSRGIPMRQLVVFGLPTDNYEARIGKKRIFFDSLPIPSKMIDLKTNWDDKFFLKQQLEKINLPIPKYVNVPVLKYNEDKILSQLGKPVIVKPRFGSRGRHTTTSIFTSNELKQSISLARKISPTVVVEEQIDGYVCRATCIDGKLAGFYRADAPTIVGDGKNTIKQLIELKNKNKQERISEFKVNNEILNHLNRLGYGLDSILPNEQKIKLTHRTGRLFGGETWEMLPELHPSFIPMLEKAALLTKLPVAGFDVIVPNPEAPALSQKWAFIECNTLPFIDLHYFALVGKPVNNIAGMVWDLWNKK